MTNNRKYKRTLIILAGLALLIMLASWQYWRVRNKVYEWHYMLTHEEPKITSRAQIDEILDEFKVVPFGQLPSSYLTSTKSDQSPYKSMLQNKMYLLIKGKDIYRKIVGNYRIHHFLPRDHSYRDHIMNIGQSDGIYWLINRELLYQFLAMQQALAAKGLQDEAFVIVNGYRPPAHNIQKGGAKKSRHILGEAVDIYVQDIDGNGWANQKDKNILLDILDKEIVGNSGGLGKYPGTMSVHFDVRGHRARWDQQ